jgi:hypothetical protein
MRGNDRCGNNRSRFHCNGKRVFSSASPSILFSGCQGYFPFLKWLGYEVNHTPSSNAEVKNEWSYTSTLPICLLGVYWDNFTFYFYLYLLPRPDVWIMCFLCKIEELVLMRFMLTVVPRSLLCNGYQVFPGGKAARAWH